MYQQLSLFGDDVQPPHIPAPPMVTASVIEAPKARDGFKPQVLRPYQEEAVTSVVEAWKERILSVLLWIATGGGKTTIFAELLRRHWNPLTQRALVIAHREELITQPHTRILNQFGGTLSQGSDIGIAMGSLNRWEVAARLVIGSIQTLRKDRVAEMLKHGAIDVLIIDEAHHCLPKNSYGKLIEQLREANPDLKILGVTATPKRGDDEALGGIFEKVAHKWTLPDGIRQGHLAPVTRVQVATRLNLSDVRTRNGDYAEGPMMEILKANNWLELCLDAYMEHLHGKRHHTLAFFPRVAMSQEFTAALQAKGIAAAHVDGETDKQVRRNITRDFTAGNYQVISNAAVFTEGFDAPATDSILLARPTRNTGLFLQIVGRGTRLFPGKTDCLLVDMAVTDRKGLNAGGLLGKTRMCRGCQAEYFTAFDKCPKCGMAHEMRIDEVLCPECYTEFSKAHRNCPECGWKRPTGGKPQDGPAAYETGPHAGRGLASSYEDLFAHAFGAWHHGTDNTFSCSAGFDKGTLVIQPPTGDSDDYQLMLVPKDSKQAVKWLDRNSDLASLMQAADEHIDEDMGQFASWRHREGEFLPMTPNQEAYLQKLGVAITGSESKDDASRLISHALATKKLKETESKIGD